MAHWSKIGKDPPRKLLGNRVFALTFASSCSAQLQSVQEEEDTAQAPAPKKDFISDRLAASAPEQVEDKWGFYAESGLNLSQTPLICTYTGARNHTSEVCNGWPTITSRYLP